MKEDQGKPSLRNVLQNFLNHIESLESQRDSKSSYESEFQELKLFSESLKHEEEYSCSEGEKDINRKKNRYKDILPFNISRVILSEYVGVRGSDYINANYIKGASGSMAYIASQGPLPNTVNDFWRMVVQCEVQVIVMACNVEESGKHKCENYWVENDSEEKQFGMVTIKLLKASTVCPDFSVRTMKLMYLNPQSQKEERTICQFHYCAWPDHGVPPLVKPLLNMVRLVRDTQASETLPVLIHCSAGCGRTGTICAIDYVWGLLRAGKLKNDFSLFSLVKNMRKQRIAMVQTKEQYVLVHQAVRELFQEQLKMIDCHPYENIDCNGMPLLKEVDPMYDTIGPPNQLNTDEKKDEKEKSSTESLIQAPPVSSKKKPLYVASKEEKEVENLSEKQRLVEHEDSSCESGSSGGSCTSSHKLKIAKLKLLFERSRRAESGHSSRKHSAIARSHSVGAVCKSTATDKDNEEWPPPKSKHKKKPARLNLDQRSSVISLDKTTEPQLSITPADKSTKRSKSVNAKITSRIKRSKSMKVIRDDERPTVTATTESDSCKQNVCDINVPCRRSMPAKSEFSRMKERGMSLESVTDALAETPNTNQGSNQQVRQVDFLLDEQSRKFLQDCRQYLLGMDAGSKNDKKSAAATRGVKERRNSFCQAVNKGQLGDSKAKEYETIIHNVPKMRPLARSHTALDVRASAVKYTIRAAGSERSVTSKPVTNHKHIHRRSSDPLKNNILSKNSSEAVTAGSSNIPLYQNVQFLGLRNSTNIHSSPVTDPQSDVVCSKQTRSSEESARKSVGKQQSPQLLPARKSLSKVTSSSNQSQEAIPATHQPIKTVPQDRLTESESQCSSSQKSFQESERIPRHSYISNTFPLQASKSSSGYSSSSSLERSLYRPRVSAAFRKSDPIVQNFFLSPNLIRKPTSQNSTPKKPDQEASMKPYLIPLVGPRLKKSPGLPNTTVPKNRPPFPPPYQTACASSANYSELCNYDVPNRSPNLVNPTFHNVRPRPDNHGNNNVSDSSNRSPNIRSGMSNASDSRGLPPDYRHVDMPSCSQSSLNQVPQNAPHSVYPKTPLSASSSWIPGVQSPTCVPSVIPAGSEEATPETCSMKHSRRSTSGNNPELASVRIRHGSRDDLALCGSGSNPPNKVKRHASVVLSRGNLVETNSHAAAKSTNRNSFQVNGVTRNPTVNYCHHSSPQQLNVNEYENWSEAPGVDLDKVAATLSKKESDSSEFMRKTLEGLHIRKRILSNSPARQEGSFSNAKSLGAQQQCSLPVAFKKQQQYL